MASPWEAVGPPPAAPPGHALYWPLSQELRRALEKAADGVGAEIGTGPPDQSKKRLDEPGTSSARKRLQREREHTGQRCVKLITDDADEDALISARMLTEEELDGTREEASGAVARAIKRLLLTLPLPVTRDGLSRAYDKLRIGLALRAAEGVPANGSRSVRRSSPRSRASARKRTAEA